MFDTIRVEWFEKGLPMLIFGAMGSVVRYLKNSNRSTYNLLTAIFTGLFCAGMMAMLSIWKKIPLELATFGAGAVGYCSNIFLDWIETTVEHKTNRQLLKSSPCQTPSQPTEQIKEEQDGTEPNTH